MTTDLKPPTDPWPVPPEMATERRTCTRIPTRAPVPVAVTKVGGPDWQATVEDVSVVGIAVRCQGRLPLELEQAVTIRHEGTSAGATVRYVNRGKEGDRIGLEWHELRPELAVVMMRSLLEKR